MFGHPFTGPTPSQELMSRKPEDLSLQSALYAWNVGFGDGANNATHALFDGDGAEGLQMFYDDGYERGEREKSVVNRMNTRHRNPRSGESDTSGEPAETSTAETPVKSTEDRVGEVRSFAGEASIEITVSPSDRDALAMARDGAVVVFAAVAVAAVVVPLWKGGRR